MKILEKIKNFILYKENDAHEFEPLLAEIEQSPINPIGPTIFWLVITFIVIASLCKFKVKYLKWYFFVYFFKNSFKKVKN